jgi:DNA-binding HxlR family transcriptional regulator
MNRRSYNEYCGVARALDLVGERWALLVVRELVLGPKRFTDLREGLPGIGTNVLSTRLRELEADGLVKKVELPPPAASTVYELTEYGRRLQPAMLALGRWGAESLGSREPAQSLRSEWFAVALRAFFKPRAARGVRATIELDLPDGPFRVRVENGSFVAARGAAPRWDLRLSADVETLIGFLSGAGVPAAALKPSGDAGLLERLPQIFPFEVQPVKVR